MRWSVDVHAMGGGPTQSYCVEAESWQGALQTTRKLRGDDSRMAGFSIDITSDGCRAVDPAKRLRYEVKRTADSTPLTAGAEAPPSKRRVSKPPPKERSSSPPRPASNGAPRHDVTPAPPRPIPTPLPAAREPAAPPPRPSPPIPPIVVKREQEATSDVPLTYREYGFALPPGTPEELAAQALREILVEVQAALASAPPGKLVNLAAFDQSFTGRPPVLPLATLTWKDWRGEPTVGFPRRARAVAPAPVDHPISDATLVAVRPAPVDIPVEAELATVVSVQPRFEPEAPQVLHFPAPVPAAGPPAEPVPPISQKRPAKPPPPKRRVRGDELVSVLFEAMHDLHFLRDAIEGGDFCLQLALEKLPSRFGLVYLYDIDHREYVIVCASGGAPAGIVGRRVPENEVGVARATRKQRAVLLAPQDPALASHVALLGGAQHVLLAPVMQSGRFLGALELVDPSDGVPFTELDANAVTYMAEQYAEFVATRGVLLDRSSQPPAMQPR